MNELYEENDIPMIANPFIKEMNSRFNRPYMEVVREAAQLKLPMKAAFTVLAIYLKTTRDPFLNVEKFVETAPALGLETIMREIEGIEKDINSYVNGKRAKRETLV